VNSYKAIVSYDGSAYSGWQIQEGLCSIQGTLQKAFERTFSHPVQLYAASRTDAGVHALGQVVLCKTSLTILPDHLRFGWNNALPDDIVIREITTAAVDFNPRTGVAQKTYHYYVHTALPLPFVGKYGWFCSRKIDFDVLKQALLLFTGTHDFRAFCTGDKYQAGTVRTIDTFSFTIIETLRVVQIVCVGERFMRHMIRRLVGAALFVATQKKVTLDDVQRVLAEKNPAHSLPTAPACGLLLYQIAYRI
jgi:tRNA pseudouridine38-40 synthase